MCVVVVVVVVVVAISDLLFFGLYFHLVRDLPRTHKDKVSLFVIHFLYCQILSL